MKEFEEMVLFKEDEKTTAIVDLKEILQTIAADEKRIQLSSEFVIETQPVEQNLNLTNTFLNPFELFKKSFAALVSPNLAYKTPF